MSFEAIVDDGLRTTDNGRLTSKDPNSSPWANSSDIFLNIKQRLELNRTYRFLIFAIFLTFNTRVK